VLLISIDGMHSIDLTNFLNDSAHLASTLKTLSNNAVIYPNAYTPAPSDSFPGMIAQVTGGTPKSTGVFYDESYDRTLFAPGSNSQGRRGPTRISPKASTWTTASSTPAASSGSH
jgi:predicted AlkP superfamily pyrophosphatase or phosphodiesterase